jgi:hypothetical protein
MEVISRYEALGMPLPDPETMCQGQCEGIGWVPVFRDDMEEPFRALWLAAEAKQHADDGWHFVQCPDCDGSGLKAA